MKIILNNNIELNPIMVTGAHEYIHGANRDTLTFIFKDMSLDALEEIFVEDNCNKITIIESDDNEYVHSGYVIRIKLSKESVMVASEIEDEPEIVESRVFVTMAQLSYAEQKLMALQEEVIMTQLATAELAESMMEV